MVSPRTRTPVSWVKFLFCDPSTIQAHLLTQTSRLHMPRYCFGADSTITYIILHLFFNIKILNSAAIKCPSFITPYFTNTKWRYTGKERCYDL